MQLFDYNTFINFFELDKEKRDFSDALLKWAEEKYPNAPFVYQCSFAGLVNYFATGEYGGYGTEFVQKERFAEHKAYEFYTRLHEELSPEQMTIAMIYFIISHLLQKSPMEDETKKKIRTAAKLLEDSKSSFKSQQVAEARKILEWMLEGC